MQTDEAIVCAGERNLFPFILPLNSTEFFSVPSLHLHALPVYSMPVVMSRLTVPGGGGIARHEMTSGIPREAHCTSYVIRP